VAGFFERFSIFTGLLCLIVTTTGVHADSTAAGRASTDAQVSAPAPLGANPALSDYLSYAAKNNPALEGAFNRWKAALERVIQVKTLPDPRFTYKYFIEKIETRSGPQRHSFMLAQQFPWFGKLKLRGDAAAREARAARQNYESAKLALFYRVKDAFYEYYYLERAINIVRQNRDLAKFFESVARTRYKVGAANHPDVIQAQVGWATLDDRLETLNTLREPIAARINAALNRPINEVVPWTKEAPHGPLDVSDTEILSWLEESNPELTALHYDIERRRLGIALADKNYYPDITVGLTYIDTGEARGSSVSTSGKDPLAASVSINLPIWRKKYDAGRKEALARYHSALSSRLDRINMLKSEARMTLYRVRDAERKINLYRDTLMPKALQAMKSTEGAYRAGKASFTALIDTQRICLAFQLACERALADHGQQAARLEMLIGKDMPRRPKNTVKPVKK